jgi:uncharacterized membrane protein
VALLGLLTYVLIPAALLGRSGRGFPVAYVLTIAGFGFSGYLTYREVFTIHAICPWCVSSALVFTLLAAIGTSRALHAERFVAATSPQAA